jgi:hypothetical protein
MKAYTEILCVKGNIWGNIISYTIFRPTPAANSTFGILDTKNFTHCGVHDCPGGSSTDIQKPEMRLVK